MDDNPIPRAVGALKAAGQTINYVAPGIADATYVGPKTSHDRFVAGDIVTHCQFITDHSLWTLEAMHPERLNRLRRMLDATQPRHDCDACLIGCNSRGDITHIGWSYGKPAISTEDTRP